MIDTLSSSNDAISLEERYGCQNYRPLPVVLSRGEGVFVWDVEGKKYYDFLSAYSALNQGHRHPRIMETFINQAKELTLTSRAFYNDKLGLAEKFFCEFFEYDRALFMNSGAEAVESAIKLSRKWAYKVKGIPENKAEIVVVENNFHGRTTTVISASSEPSARNEFGPFTPGFNIIPYNDIGALEEALKNPEVCAFLMEPIQGEAGVLIPDDGYLEKCRELCNQHNVLLVLDEIQTGLGRTGRMMAADHERVKPDMVTLGKAVSGGIMPISVVLAKAEIMLTINPGEHGSTFGGNPLACAVAMEAVKVIQEENMAENAESMGKIFRERLKPLTDNCQFVKEVRGKGLLNAIEIDETKESETAWNICLNLKKEGLLAKPTHGNVIRFAPPLIINADQMHECCDMIEKVMIKYSE